MLFIPPYKAIFLLFIFLLYNDVYSEHTERFKKDDKEFKDFLFENYYRQTRFPKGNSCYSVKQKKKDFLLLSTKLIEKIPQKSEKILDEKNANVIIWSHD